MRCMDGWRPPAEPVRSIEACIPFTIYIPDTCLLAHAQRSEEDHVNKAFISAGPLTGTYLPSEIRGLIHH